MVGGVSNLGFIHTKHAISATELHPCFRDIFILSGITLVVIKLIFLTLSWLSFQSVLKNWEDWLFKHIGKRTLSQFNFTSVNLANVIPAIFSLHIMLSLSFCSLNTLLWWDKRFLSTGKYPDVHIPEFHCILSLELHNERSTKRKDSCNVLSEPFECK